MDAAVRRGIEDALAGRRIRRRAIADGLPERAERPARAGRWTGAADHERSGSHRAGRGAAGAANGLGCPCSGHALGGESASFD